MLFQVVLLPSLHLVNPPLDSPAGLSINQTISTLWQAPLRAFGSDRADFSTLFNPQLRYSEGWETFFRSLSAENNLKVVAELEAVPSYEGRTVLIPAPSKYIFAIAGCVVVCGEMLSLPPLSRARSAKNPNRKIPSVLPPVAPMVIDPMVVEGDVPAMSVDPNPLPSFPGLYGSFLDSMRKSPIDTNTDTASLSETSYELLCFD